MVVLKNKSISKSFCMYWLIWSPSPYTYCSFAWGIYMERLFLFLKSTSIPSSSLLPEVIVLCIWHCGSVCRWWWHLQQRPRFNWGINAMSRWGLGRQLFSLNGNFYNKDWQMWKHRDLGYAVYEPRNSVCRQSVPWLFIPSWDLL